jgi:predicted ArsR family transcriptional regulator
MHTSAILQYLSKHGQQVDYEIAAAMDLPLSDVRATLSALSKLGEISRCNVTRFIGGKPIEGMLCRIAGTIPPKAPGRKPGA